MDKLIDGDSAITAIQYYNFGNGIRRNIKDKLKKIYCSHLKGGAISMSEQAVLSAAIPILLWKIQGKSFSETLSLRHSYLTERDKRRDLSRKLRVGIIDIDEYEKSLDNIKIKYSVKADRIPNSRLRNLPLFSNVPVRNISYDLLVYDTYDYLDKVIGLSLSDPLSASLTIYFNETGDERAKVLINYIKFGTNDNKEIWLLKYGFDPEDVSWILDIVVHVDEHGIIFKENLDHLTDEQVATIKRYRR